MYIYEFEEIGTKCYYEVTENKLTKEELKNRNFYFDKVNVYNTDKIVVNDTEYTDVHMINKELTDDNIKAYVDDMRYDIFDEQIVLK